MCDNFLYGFKAAPLRGTASGAPRAGLWPWGPTRRARAVPGRGCAAALEGSSAQTAGPSSSLPIVQLAATASRAALRAVACQGRVVKGRLLVSRTRRVAAC
jgi:hypothetical protein